MSDDDITPQVGRNADKEAEVQQHIREEIRKLYDVYSYGHAAAIMKTCFPRELAEIEQALMEFRMTTDDIATSGGSESPIPKKLSALLPNDWRETRIKGDLVIGVESEKKDKSRSEKLTLNNYIDGHKIDHVKGRVALDVEWNSKDQTYDRDLYAFRTFHECGIISVASLITRSEKLNKAFARIPQKNKDGTDKKDDSGNVKYCIAKYGASTTWMGKLLYRLNAGRHGGCPVLVFGIRPEVITDYDSEGKEQP